MDLKKLTDKEIDLALGRSVKKEKEAFREIVVILLEVERRKLYLKLGFKSMAHYLIKSHGCSETSAYRKISAMKIVREIPETLSLLAQNKIHMSQLGSFKRALKQKESENHERIPASTKLDLLKAVLGKTDAQTQEILANKLDLKLRKPETNNKQKDGSIHTDFTQDEELQDLVKQCKEISAHRMQQNHQEQTLANMIKLLAKEYIQHHTPKAGKSKAKTLTPKRRCEIIEEQKCCQFKISETEICGSTHFLQVDHIQSKWAGGTDEDSNLQVLCSLHNRFKSHLERRSFDPSRDRVQ